MFDSFMQMGTGAAAFLSVVAVSIGIFGVAVLTSRSRRMAQEAEYAERRWEMTRQDRVEPTVSRKR